MPSYEVKSFTGLSDFQHKGTPGSFQFGANIDVRKDKDTISAKQALTDEGLTSSSSPSASPSPSSSPSASPSLSPSASPSTTPSPSASASPSSSVSLSPSPTPSSSISASPSPSEALTSVFRDLIKWFVKTSIGYTYGLGNTGYIYRRDADGLWLQVYKDPDGEIKGGAEWYHENGKVYLYWATDTVLKRKELPGLDNWNDVETVGSNLTSASSHMMREAGGSLIIANGANLALVGYDESYTPAALDLIPGNLAHTIVERNGRTIVGTRRADDPDVGINAAIDTEVPLAQVGTNGELFFANMLDSVPVKTFPGGGQVNPGGVTNEVDQVNFFEWEQTALSWIDKQSVGNMALFAVYGNGTGKSGIYSYGRKAKNKPFTLNLDYQLDADELGALVSVDTVVLVSYKDGSDFGVKAVDSTTKADTVYEGLELNIRGKSVDEVGVWTTAEIYLEPLPANASVEFWYKVNRTGSFIQAKMKGEVTQLTAENEIRAVFEIGAQGDILTPKIITNSYQNNSVEVNRFIVNFE